MWGILGIALILGDIYWVYRLGFANAFSNFGTAIAIVFLALIGVF